MTGAVQLMLLYCVFRFRVIEAVDCVRRAAAQGTSMIVERWGCAARARAPMLAMGRADV